MRCEGAMCTLTLNPPGLPPMGEDLGLLRLEAGIADPTFLPLQAGWS